VKFGFHPEAEAEHYEAIAYYESRCAARTGRRVEAGNFAVGMIRRRARGMLDTNCFKLKIRQSATPEPPLALFPTVR
jgi:hypothetical protein